MIVAMTDLNLLDRMTVEIGENLRSQDADRFDMVGSDLHT